MNPQEWSTWLRQWLTRHPVKTPPAQQGTEYVREVMARVRPPQVVFRPAWEWRPRPVFVLAAACALLLVVILRPGGRGMATLEREWQLLADVGEVPELNGVNLEEELREVDRWMLAKADSSASAPDAVEETLQLFDELGVDPELEDSESPEEWLQELDEAALT